MKRIKDGKKERRKNEKEKMKEKQKSNNNWQKIIDRKNPNLKSLY